MSRRHALVLVCTISAFAGPTRGEDLKDYDAGFLRGLGAAFAMLGEFTEGHGDADYHCGSYTFRRSVAGQIAAALEGETSALHLPRLRTALLELAKDIRAASPDGRGDAHYWVGMLNQQRNLHKRARERYDSLVAELLPEATITADREAGYLKGLRVGVKSMLDQTKTHGDMDYFIRLFVLQRETAKLVAGVIERDVENIPNRFLKVTLEELAKDIRSAPETGKGDLQYWAGDIRTPQRRTLARVSEKLGAYVRLATSAAPACERLVGGDDGGLPRFNLKEI